MRRIAVTVRILRDPFSRWHYYASVLSHSGNKKRFVAFCGPCRKTKAWARRDANRVIRALGWMEVRPAKNQSQGART